MKTCKLIFLLATLIFSSCSLFEDPDKHTYYQTEGVGCVYYEKTGLPAPNIEVTVLNYFKDHGKWATKPYLYEYYYTDSLGNFSVKFLRHTDLEDVAGHYVSAYDFNGNIPSQEIYISNDVLSKTKTNILIDTLFLHNPLTN
jgi:hypothetical protein